MEDMRTTEEPSAHTRPPDKEQRADSSGKKSVLEGKVGVNFRETCDFYKISGAEGDQPSQQKPKPLKSLRYFIMLIGLVSPFVTTYSRTIINFAIIDMIEPELTVRPSIESTLKAEQLEAQVNETGRSVHYFELDGSCPVDDEQRARLVAAAECAQSRDGGGLLTDNERRTDRYRWDAFKQGLLKSAYAIGHAPFQIPGSRLAEIYGSRRIMSAGTALIGAACLLAPHLAALSFYLIFLDLVLLGLLGSFMTPAFINLLTHWLTPGEKSIMISLYLVASRLGYALSSMLCGLLIDANYSWRHVFYSAGWLALAYSTLFLICARSRPREHPLMGQEELAYLATKNRLVAESLLEAAAAEAKKSSQLNENFELKRVEVLNDAKPAGGLVSASGQQAKVVAASKLKEKRRSAPWFAIFTSVPVWAFIVTKFCVKLAGDAVQIELPTYLSKVMHFSPRANGFINAWNYIIFCASSFAVGAFGKWALKRRPFGLSKTTLRKCFQCTASFGVGLVLVGLACSVCNSTFTQLWLMLQFFLTTFGVAGEAQIPIDITERYSGTIHAIGSSLAISGIIEPTLVGFFLRDRSANQDSWRFVWLAASFVSFFGGFVFLLFADASIQPFDSVDLDEDEHRGEESKKAASADNKAFEPDSTSHQATVVAEVNKDEPQTYRESREI